MRGRGGGPPGSLTVNALDFSGLGVQNNFRRNAVGDEVAALEEGGSE